MAQQLAIGQRLGAGQLVRFGVLNGIVGAFVEFFPEARQCVVLEKAFLRFAFGLGIEMKHNSQIAHAGQRSLSCRRQAGTAEQRPGSAAVESARLRVRDPVGVADFIQAVIVGNLGQEGNTGGDGDHVAALHFASDLVRSELADLAAHPSEGKMTICRCPVTPSLSRKRNRKFCSKRIFSKRELKVRSSSICGWEPLMGIPAFCNRCGSIQTLARSLLAVAVSVKLLPAGTLMGDTSPPCSDTCAGSKLLFAA